MAVRAYEEIRYESAGGIATITLDDPETRNALSAELLDELIRALEAARDDERVRVLVLTSSHDKVFSAGGNLAGFGADAPTVHKHFASEQFPRVFKLLAQFGTPEINVGLFPFMIMALIYRNVPRKKTNEMLLLGERLSADEAREAGIVNRVVPDAQFDDAVAEWARKLASKSPVLMKLGKDAMYRQLDMPFEDALDFLRAQLSIAFTTEDIQEGVTAFFEKRDPVWSGR